MSKMKMGFILLGIILAAMTGYFLLNLVLRKSTLTTVLENFTKMESCRINVTGYAKKSIEGISTDIVINGEMEWDIKQNRYEAVTELMKKDGESLVNYRFLATLSEGIKIVGENQMDYSHYRMDAFFFEPFTESDFKYIGMENGQLIYSISLDKNPVQLFSQAFDSNFGFVSDYFKEASFEIIISNEMKEITKIRIFDKNEAEQKVIFEFVYI